MDEQDASEFEQALTVAILQARAARVEWNRIVTPLIEFAAKVSTVAEAPVQFAARASVVKHAQAELLAALAALVNELAKAT